jgi:hypothetical protein
MAATSSNASQKSTGLHRDIEAAEAALDEAIDDVNAVRDEFDRIKGRILDLYDDADGGPPAATLEQMRQALETLYDHAVRIALSLTGECGALSVIEDPSSIDDPELREAAKRIADRYQVEFAESRYRVLIDGLESSIDVVREDLEARTRSAGTNTEE